MLLSLSGVLFEDNYVSQSVSFEEFCEIASSTGYGGVELRNTQVNLDAPVQRRRELLNIVEDAGLKVTCLTARGLTASGIELSETFIRYLDLCKDMRCNLLKVGGDPLWLREAAEKAGEFDVILATNNHIGGALETVNGTKQYFQQVCHPNHGLLYDSLHLRLNNQDYLSCIPEFCNITQNILVHSMREAQLDEKVFLNIGGKKWTVALPDEPGVQKWPAIFSSFACQGYDGLITVIENGWPTNEREYVAKRNADLIRQSWPT